MSSFKNKGQNGNTVHKKKKKKTEKKKKKKKKN